MAAPEPPPGPPAVSFEPRTGGYAERVLRFHVRDEQRRLQAADAWLFRGELSKYDLGRIARRDLPGTLSARRIALSAFRAQDASELCAQPTEPLELGAVYSLATPEFGLLARVEVSAEPLLPLLERSYPPHGVGGSFVVYCGPDAPSAALSLRLEPSGAALTLEPMAELSEHGERCVSGLVPSAAQAEPQLLPSEADGVLWDPAPLSPVDLVDAALPLACSAEEVELGPGCASVADDRLWLRTPQTPLLWLFSEPAPAQALALSPSTSWLLRGLEPDSRVCLAGKTLDPTGSELAFNVTLQTLPPRPHWVLNEVLANALGPEPAAEWIELLNDSDAPARLGGLSLADSGGSLALPDVEIAARQYALLVRNDFEAAAGADVAPLPGTQLVRVSSLGKGGLANGGESLSLLDAGGQVISSFPARASPHAGVSVARRSPSSRDDDVAAFAEHAPPGASPGAPNQLPAP